MKISVSIVLRILLIGLFSCLVLAVASCTPEVTPTPGTPATPTPGIPATPTPAPTVAPETILLRCAASLNEEHPAIYLFPEYIKRVEERTNGQVKIEFYHTGALYKSGDIAMAIQEGAVEMAIHTLSRWGNVPSELALSQSFFYDDAAHLFRCWDGEVGQIVLEELEKVGNTHGLTQFHTGSGLTVCNHSKLLTKPEDFTGELLRTPSGSIATFVTAMGGAPSDIAYGETYIAMQRGTVDGAVAGMAGTLSMKWYEVAPYIVHAPSLVSGTTNVLMVNLDVWNSLSPDVQRIMAEEAINMRDRIRVEIDKYQTSVGRWGDLRNKPGVTSYTLSVEEAKAWSERVRPAMVADFEKRVGKERAQQLLELIEKER